MKTLEDRGVHNEVLRRIDALTAEDKARWGSMSVNQMICHLADAYDFALGKKPVAPLRAPLPPAAFKWLALNVPIQWRPGFRSPPEIAQDRSGTPPGEFEADRLRLLAVLDLFRTALPQPAPVHPYFGLMTNWDWQRWGYLHADHHLRQFGR